MKRSFRISKKELFEFLRSIRLNENQITDPVLKSFYEVFLELRSFVENANYRDLGTFLIQTYRNDQNVKVFGEEAIKFDTVLGNFLKTFSKMFGTYRDALENGKSLDSLKTQITEIIGKLQQLLAAQQQKNSKMFGELQEKVQALPQENKQQYLNILTRFQNSVKQTYNFAQKLKTANLAGEQPQVTNQQVQTS
ncbi:MAG TPA: hypothetical protein PLP33_16315 [Leptospiraceae bacterium]|nr:hypothetical protein [Leptospiraceae bacterium]